MIRFVWLALGLMMAMPAVAAPPKVVSSIDLSKPFATHRAWTFMATQAPDIPDPTGEETELVPGPITLCLSPDGGKTCAAALSDAFRQQNPDDLFDQPHAIERVAIEHMPGTAARPLLFVKTASVLSTDGNARVVTQIMVYDRPRDDFTLAYQHVSGHNNSEDLRYVAGGPLAGAVVVAEPTQDAPFGFWVTVNRLKGEQFEPVLRYRSATRHGDGNPLSVIDSEMPNLEQHLGLWRPGQPLPLPAGPCPQPHLVKGALWCR